MILAEYPLAVLWTVLVVGVLVYVIVGQRRFNEPRPQRALTEEELAARKRRSLDR